MNQRVGALVHSPLPVSVSDVSASKRSDLTPLSPRGRGFLGVKLFHIEVA